MLIFNRPAFKSGVMVIKVSVADVEYSFALKTSDKGTTKAYAAEGADTAALEAAIVTKYPAFFEVPG